MAVLFPVQVAFGAGAKAPTVLVEAVADNRDAALAEAGAFAVAMRRLADRGAQPTQPTSLTPGLAQSCDAGPCLYVLERAGSVRAYTLPAHLEQDSGQRLADMLAGLQPQGVHAVLFDCARLVYINTGGLTAIVTAGRRLPLHLYRIPKSIHDVLDTVGLLRVLNHHADLAAALDAVLTARASAG